MKCPKCAYLGFDTGDRCKNCGYDFSLLADHDPRDPVDADLRLRDPEPGVRLPDLPLDPFDPPLVGPSGGVPQAARETPVDFSLVLKPDAGAAPTSGMTASHDPVVRGSAPKAGTTEPTLRTDAALPLFTPRHDDDDTPLIKVPATPRAPLAVRRTPDSPRLRPVAKVLPKQHVEPALAFAEEDEDADAPAEPQQKPARVTPAEPVSRVWNGAATVGQPSGAARRVLAAIIDHTILSAIDVGVIYFTARMVALEFGDWTLLPRVPLFTFLLLIKLAYFAAFTAVGGQTIGKMAARIRVVGANAGQISGGDAIRRTLFGAVSTLALGVGFIPALFGDHLALHDRAARTRVVGLESA